MFKFVLVGLPPNGLTNGVTFVAGLIALLEKLNMLVVIFVI